MEASMKQPLVIALLFAMFPLSIHAGINTRRDGNWWNEETRGEKLDYVTGFFDGMDLGSRFSYWGILDTYGKDATCANQALASYNDFDKKFFTNLTNTQITDGLDTFYKDYRNRSIKVFDAVWIVLNTIAGTSQADIDKMIENWRKNASGN
jgi:hypothetical protein